MSQSDSQKHRTPEISSEQLQAYLQATDWFEDGKIRNVATIWHRQENENAEAEVMLPLATVKDYRHRLYDAISAIALFERRGAIEVINEVKQIFSNRITVRVIHADTEDGTIPINDGVLLIAKAKDLLLAAAQSIHSKKKLFTGPTNKDAKMYLDSLLLGQTEVGSYIVNIISPIHEELAIKNPENAELPLNQAVTLNLIASLEALKRASVKYEESGDISSFDEAIISGASANMCDALLGFSGEQHNRTFEVSVKAALGPLFPTAPKKFQFDGKNVELLEKATNYYKDDYVLHRRTLVGYIRKLSRQKNETSGTVTLQAHVGGIERNVQLELSGDDYHLAILAHDNSERVRVDGDVHIKSKRSHLLNAANFGVIKIEDLF